MLLLSYFRVDHQSHILLLFRLFEFCGVSGPVKSIAPHNMRGQSVGAAFLIESS